MSSIADNPLANVRLCDRLQGPERFIADQLGISGYLAVATVAMRARPAGRLAMSRDQVSAFVEAVTALGVHCCIGRVLLVNIPDAIPETRHAALFVTDDRPTAMSLVYFGVSAEIAAGAEQVELYAGHRLLGQLFGYPDCCAEVFVNSETAGPDRLPSTINSLGPFDRIMNPISTYVYRVPSLLFHFPCSPGCKPSITLSHQRSRLLAQIEPSILTIENLGQAWRFTAPKSESVWRPNTRGKIQTPFGYIKSSRGHKRLMNCSAREPKRPSDSIPRAYLKSIDGGFPAPINLAHCSPRKGGLQFSV